MTPHAIEVTENLEIGPHSHGYYIHAERTVGGDIVLSRPDLEALRAAIGELLEEEE